MQRRYIQLPASLRTYIRRRKAAIRREYGANSAQEEEFLQWVHEKRQEKRRWLEKRL